MLTLPAAGSYLAVQHEAAITQWVRERESALIVGVFVLLSALLHPRLQRLLIVTLCYGVAFIAARDIFHVLDYPRPISCVTIASIRAGMLGSVAVLAFAGAVTESLKANTLLARRFYMAAAGFYFLDQGILQLIWRGSWQSAFLLTAGVLCGIGCIFARYLSLAPEPGMVVDEAQEERERLALQHKLLALKEWRDPETEETETPALSNSLGDQEDWGRAGVSPSH
jgi:hypothetical protein